MVKTIPKTGSKVKEFITNDPIDYIQTNYIDGTALRSAGYLKFKTMDGKIFHMDGPISQGSGKTF